MGAWGADIRLFEERSHSGDYRFDVAIEESERFPDWRSVSDGGPSLVERYLVGAASISTSPSAGGNQRASSAPSSSDPDGWTHSPSTDIPCRTLTPIESISDRVRCRVRCLSMFDSSWSTQSVSPSGSKPRSRARNGCTTRSVLGRSRVTWKTKRSSLESASCSSVTE